MSTRSLSFLVPDVGAPSVGAALRMAQMLRNEFDIEIVGPDFGRGVNSMYRSDFAFKTIACPRLYRLPDFWWESRRIEYAITGDIVIALKAFRNTLPLALRAKERRGARVAVFLDEWDGAVLSTLSWGKRLCRRLKQWHHPLDDAHYEAVERRIPQADTVLSTTTFLQRKFGGHVIAMGVDTEHFRPQSEDAVSGLKAQLGLAGKRLIVFGGVVRPHKGIEIIPEALSQLGDENLRLLVVGPVTEHLNALLQNPRYAKWIRVAGAPLDDPDGVNAAIHKQMPLYLDLADMIVLPLLDTPLAQSQMPIKVFEALAMGKPIIASNVADLPSMLKECGKIVPPNDVGALADAIGALAANPAAAREMGARARNICEAEYALPVVGQRLAAILRAL